MWKKLIRSFTLIEVVFVAVVVSISLVSILYAINYALENVKSTKQRVIAINLAREGMEWIYQIRDTNRLIWPAKKDECRLDMNPLIDEDNSSCVTQPCGCRDDIWMSGGNYILQKIISGNQQSFYLSWWSDWNKLDLSDWIQTGDMKFALCLSWGLREACPNYTLPVAYFREIHWEWLFYKDSNTTGWDTINCKNWNSTYIINTESHNCRWTEAKEYRFCSKVSYIWQWQWSVELCGLITNFWK